MIATLLAVTSLWGGQEQQEYRSMAADWECATPLIARSHRRTRPRAERFAPAIDLADAIADECTPPYAPRPTRSDVDRQFELNERTIYGYNRAAFRREILDQLMQARRGRSIDFD